MEEQGVGVVRARACRRHREEFKEVVLAACTMPGARVSEVAAAHGVNPNLVYKWRQRSARAAHSNQTNAERMVATFVPIHVEVESAQPGAPESEASIMPMVLS